MRVCKQVYVLDAQASCSDALTQAIQGKMPDCRVSLYVSELELIQRLAGGPRPDVIVYDVLASGVSGILGLKYLSARFPGVRLIALCSDDAGAAGAALRQSLVSTTLSRMAGVDDMVTGIRQVMAEDGQQPSRRSRERSGDEALRQVMDKIGCLSPKRYCALLMIAEGRLNKEVAWEIRATESTVKAMVTAFLRIFQVRTRTELAVMLARLELRLLLGCGLGQEPVREGLFRAA